MNLSIKLTKFGKEEVHILEIGVNGSYKVHKFISTSDNVESLFSAFVEVATEKFKEIVSDLNISKKIEKSTSGVFPTSLEEALSIKVDQPKPKGKWKKK